MIDYSKKPAQTKVVLTKSAPTVSLTKAGSTSGVMRVNLNWSSRPDRGGMLSRLLGGAIDLDLGCLYEYKNGTKGVIQALGNSFSDDRRPPIVRLDGDDRSGANQGGENLFIDLSKADKIRRILVFAYIYSGTPNWAAANGVVTLYPATGPQVELSLDDHGSAKTVALFMLTNDGCGDLTVQREMRSIHGSQSDLDRVYGWGLHWTPGRK